MIAKNVKIRSKNICWHLLICAHCLTLPACETDDSKLRSQRPPEEGEGLPEYLDTVEKDVPTNSAVKVALGSTTVSFPKASSEADYKVRLSQLKTTPNLSTDAKAVLSNAKSDVVLVEVYDAETNRIYESSQLLKPYIFEQDLGSSGPTSSLGLVVLTDMGTANEKLTLLPAEELAIIKGAGLFASSIKVQVKLRVTSGVMWLANYTEDALTTLTIGTASELVSSGGAAAQTITIGNNSREATFADAAISINAGASYANDAAVSLTLTAKNATEMYLTFDAQCGSGGSWEAFNSTKTVTLISSNSTVRMYVKFRNASLEESSCINASIIHDDINPEAVGSFNDGITTSSSSQSPLLSWTAAADSGSGISYYEIAFGNSPGGSNVKDWQSVSNVTSIIMSGLNLNPGDTYYASIRAVDGAGNVSTIVQGDGFSASATDLDCTTLSHGTWIKVPGNTEVGQNNDFCVMKYEAKDVGGTATSQAALTPWTNISQADANSKCTVLGTNYKLMTNQMWQTIARNIEVAQSPPGYFLNWKYAQVILADSLINHGHSDNDPSLALAADADSNPCSGTNQAACANTSDDDFSQKRTHTLSNGEVIWDFAGNVSEWTTASSAAVCDDMFVSQYSIEDKATWGPSGDYSSKNSGAYGGLGFGSLNHSGAVARGGNYAENAGAGIFAATLLTENTDFGFRCVYE